MNMQSLDIITPLNKTTHLLLFHQMDGKWTGNYQYHIPQWHPWFHNRQLTICGSQTSIKNGHIIISIISICYNRQLTLCDFINIIKEHTRIDNLLSVISRQEWWMDTQIINIIISTITFHNISQLTTHFLWTWSYQYHLSTIFWNGQPTLYDFIKRSKIGHKIISIITLNNITQWTTHILLNEEYPWNHWHHHLNKFWNDQLTSYEESA